MSENLKSGAFDWLGMPVAQFREQYWQVKPLLIRGAFESLTDWVGGDDLAALSADTDVVSRVIRGSDDDGRWSSDPGPFADDHWDALGDRDWTLLVSDVDKWIPSVGDVLENFAFVPGWRIDDIMISFAAPGGSVGPHVDHYDVFLIQTSGKRKWAVETRRSSADRGFQPDQPLRLVDDFSPSETWTVEPGDVLYLPAGFAHHGVAVESCVTWSVGMRAPAVHELFSFYADRLIDLGDESHRFASEPSDGADEITDQMVDDCFERMEQLLRFDQASRRRWLGEALTGYRLATDMGAGSGETHLPMNEPMRRNPWARWAWSRDSGEEGWLHVNGHSIRMKTALAQGFAESRILKSELVNQSPELVAELIDNGLLLAVEDDDAS